MFDKEVISIDIGSQNTKIAVGRQQGSNLIISSAFMFATPVNSIQDGKIMDMDRLVESIRKALSENKVKSKKATLTIESTSVIRREIELPMVKPEELSTMVKYEVEQYLPIMMSEYIIEYKIIDEYTEDQIKKCKILVAAMPKTVAEEFLLLVRTLGLTPMSLDINSNVVTKLFSVKSNVNGMAYDPEKTIAVLDIGYSNINLTIVSKGSTRFSRLINSGGYDIDINLTNSFNLEIKQAEERKKQEADLGAASLNPLEAMLTESVKGNIDSWVSEIQRMFQYYTSRDNKNKIDEIYLYGGSSNLKGLEEYVKSSMNLPTYKINSFGNVKTSKQDSLAMEYYLNSIGAIMRK